VFVPPVFNKNSVHQVVKKLKNTNGVAFYTFISPDGSKFYTKSGAYDNGMKD